MLNREDVLPPEENQWQEIDESKLTLAERCVYRNRRRALELSRKGSSPKEIFRMTGISHAALVPSRKGVPHRIRKPESAMAMRD